VIFVSGDQAICDDAKRLLGPIETVTVKEATGFHSAIMMHPEEAQRRIREGVKRAIERREKVRPYKLEHPVKLEITFKKTAIAEVLSYLPGVERPQGNVVVFTATDMLEASGFLNIALYLDVS
jgi:D-amino peptidase